MRILGIDNLNNYELIIINIANPKYEVKILGNSKPITNNFDYKLNGLSNNDKIMKIVNYFLDNSDLCRLSNNESFKSKKLFGGYTIAYTTDNKLLALKLNSSKLSNRIKKLVDLKYDEDRYKHFSNNNISWIYLSDSNTKKYCNNVLYLRLDKKCGDYYVENNERKFLETILNEKFNHENRAYIETFIKDDKIKKYIICGDVKIYIDDIELLENAVLKIIDNYNMSLNKQYPEKIYKIKFNYKEE